MNKKDLIQQFNDWHPLYKIAWWLFIFDAYETEDDYVVLKFNWWNPLLILVVVVYSLYETIRSTKDLNNDYNWIKENDPGKMKYFPRIYKTSKS